ncbi:MAG: MFS transporter [Promethearchaeota archaeon]|nr:MAG: MFS transporter [Candidatus Lokiarchaeota archaeon]
MEQTNVNHHWRFWPVMCLAILYPINYSLIYLAIPLYFFNIGTEIHVIGFLVAGTTMAYCFSPLLLSKIGERLGRRKSIIIALSGVSLAQIIFYFTLEPSYFLISRVCEGFVTGLYWSSLQSSISDTSLKKQDAYLSRFNFSWTFGTLIGFLTGAILLFNFEDVEFIFHVAPLLIFLNLFIAIIFFQEPVKEVNHDLLSQGTDQNTSSNHLRVQTTVILFILFIISYGLAKNSTNFLYPLKSEIIGFDSYTVYLLAFFALISQVIATSLASYLNLNTLKKLTVMSLTSLIVINIILGFNYNFFIFIILFFFVGFFAGILYACGLKLSIMLNFEKNTSKYSSIIESMMGVIFLIAPIFSGYIASINLALSFYIISITLIFMLILSLYFMKKMQV